MEECLTRKLVTSQPSSHCLFVRMPLVSITYAPVVGLMLSQNAVNDEKGKNKASAPNKNRLVYIYSGCGQKKMCLIATYAQPHFFTDG